MRISSGTLRNKELIFPKGLEARPTTSKVRMQAFNICQHLVEQALFLDLFAGSGAMGFEALSRGATRCTFVEQDRNVVSALRENVKRFGLEESCSILPMDALLAIKKLQNSPPFTLVYIDPPYDLVGSSFFNKLLACIDKDLPLIPGGSLFIETRKKCTEPLLPSFTLSSRRTSGQSELWHFEKIQHE